MERTSAGKGRETLVLSEVTATVRTTSTASPARGQVADFRAKARAAGQERAGGRPGDLLELLTRVAAGDPGLTAVERAGVRLLQDFLDGYQGRTVADVPRDLAADLIDGDPLPPEVTAGLAARYLVAVLSLAKSGCDPNALLAAGGPDTLMTYRDENVVLLVPVGVADSAEQVVTRLARCLGGGGWFATAERERAHLAEGFDEAFFVLRLVMAGRRPIGGYTISDVLVEYAVMSNEQVRSDLAAVIRPLRAHPALWKTLTTFIECDHSKHKTARRLFVHRSTLDHRLRRVAAITGCDPSTGRGAYLLTAALVAEAVETPWA